MYTPACDVFSLGVTLYVLLMGYPPFVGKTQQEIFDLKEYVCPSLRNLLEMATTSSLRMIGEISRLLR